MAPARIQCRREDHGVVHARRPRRPGAVRVVHPSASAQPGAARATADPAWLMALSNSRRVIQAVARFYCMNHRPPSQLADAAGVLLLQLGGRPKEKRCPRGRLGDGAEVWSARRTSVRSGHRTPSQVLIRTFPLGGIRSCTARRPPRSAGRHGIADVDCSGDRSDRLVAPTIPVPPGRDRLPVVSEHVLTAPPIAGGHGLGRPRAVRQ